VLEVFAKLKVGKMAKSAAASDREKANSFYAKLRLKSVESFCALLERHTQFNYRLNILQLVCSKLSN